MKAENEQDEAQEEVRDVSPEAEEHWDGEFDDVDEFGDSGSQGFGDEGCGNWDHQGNGWLIVEEDRAYEHTLVAVVGGGVDCGCGFGGESIDGDPLMQSLEHQFQIGWIALQFLLFLNFFFHRLFHQFSFTCKIILERLYIQDVYAKIIRR